ncbi:MAG: hypothetical protein IPK57_12525 [Chitinophagaceae bacterium]|nr:hypothetical protein [Chitinophagaceae bacterium]
MSFKTIKLSFSALVVLMVTSVLFFSCDKEPIGPTAGPDLHSLREPI